MHTTRRSFLAGLGSVTGAMALPPAARVLALPAKAGAANREGNAYRYQFSPDRGANWFYWNGSRWAVSDGSYAQSSDGVSTDQPLPNGMDYRDARIRLVFDPRGPAVRGI